MKSLLKRFSGHYSLSIPYINSLNLQCSITQQLLSTLCSSSWTYRRSSVSNIIISCTDQSHYFSLCQSADEFHMAGDWKKRKHSKSLLFLLYVAHLLPLARKSDEIMGYIFHTEDRSICWHGPSNFHANFTLNGWNDHIIQPARDAVLDYYKVCTQYPTYAVLALISVQPNIIYSLNQRYAKPSDVKEYIASIIYPSASFLWLYTFNGFPINAFHAIPIE